MNDCLYIIIPAYNEQDTISDVVKDWYNVLEGKNNNSRLIVVNDGSKDNTQNILLKLKNEFSKLEVLEKENGGHGDSLLFGYNYALKSNADYIFQTDSDGQTDYREFEQFWEERQKYDAIIGHRNNRQDGLSRFFVTKVLKFVLFCIFGVAITDANTPFRLIKKEALSESLKVIPKHYNLPNVIMSVYFAKKNKNIKYIPVSFKPRQGGVNSINLKKIFIIGKNALNDFKDINKKIELV